MTKYKIIIASHSASRHTHRPSDVPSAQYVTARYSWSQLVPDDAIHIVPDQEAGAHLLERRQPHTERACT
jgi:hypothetical protein